MVIKWNGALIGHSHGEPFFLSFLEIKKGWAQVRKNGFMVPTTLYVSGRYTFPKTCSRNIGSVM